MCVCLFRKTFGCLLEVSHFEIHTRPKSLLTKTVAIRNEDDVRYGVHFANQWLCHIFDYRSQGPITNLKHGPMTLNGGAHTDILCGLPWSSSRRKPCWHCALRPNSLVQRGIEPPNHSSHQYPCTNSNYEEKAHKKNACYLTLINNFDRWHLSILRQNLKYRLIAGNGVLLRKSMSPFGYVILFTPLAIWRVRSDMTSIVLRRPFRKMLNGVFLTPSFAPHRQASVSPLHYRTRRSPTPVFQFSTLLSNHNTLAKTKTTTKPTYNL